MRNILFTMDPHLPSSQRLCSSRRVCSSRLALQEPGRHNNFDGGVKKLKPSTHCPSPMSKSVQSRDSVSSLRKAETAEIKISLFAHGWYIQSTYLYNCTTTRSDLKSHIIPLSRTLYTHNIKSTQLMQPDTVPTGHYSTIHNR
jgi:hypothetical protein